MKGAVVEPTRFIPLGDWRTKVRSISAPSEEFSDPSHRRDQQLVMIDTGGRATGGWREDPRAPPCLPTPPFGQFLPPGGSRGGSRPRGLLLHGLRVGEMAEEGGQGGLRAAPPAVVDQVQADFPVGVEIFDIGRTFAASMIARQPGPRSPRAGRRSSAPGGRRGRGRRRLFSRREREHAGEFSFTRPDRRQGVRGGVDEGRSPAPIVKVRTSKSRSEGRSPYRCTARSWIFLAVATFSSTVIAIPFSWIVRAMTAAP